MKTLSLALLAATLIAGPVLADSLPTAPATATAPANKTELSKNWTVGQKVPTAFVNTSRFKLNNFEEYSLDKPGTGSRWIMVGDNAYLIREASDVIVKIVGVTPKS